MPGLPQPGAGQRDQTKFIIFEGFKKMNTQALRAGLPENELNWLENLQPIAANNLAAVPGKALNALGTIAETVSLMFYVPLASGDYFACFTTAGAGYSVNIATGLVAQFAADGTFSPTPDLAIWQGQRALINDPVSGYCTWDGNSVAKTGSVSPNVVITAPGAYATPPAVTISGGSGTGATATAVLTGNFVTGINLTNPGSGYKPTDTLTVAFSAPPGSGATASAIMSGSPVSNVAINNAGQFAYALTTNPLVFSGGGGSGAAGFATMSFPNPNYAVVGSITMTASGSGYTSTPSVSLQNAINPPSGGFGFIVPVLQAIMGNQSIIGISVGAGGTGYVAPPAVLFTPSGGASATSHLTGTSVSSITVNSGGSFAAGVTPAVTIGQSATAAATAHVWPTVPAGTTLAVFQGRVWLGGGQLLQWTGTGASYGNVGYDDFLAADASGSLRITDSDLIHAITALRSYNNYLFILGDQSVKQIGSISLNSAGNVTLFTILTLSSDQGTIWPKSCVSFNRVFMFANPLGVYGVFGSSVQKLSSDLDGIFGLLDFSIVPQAAILDVTAIHNACYLLRYKDPIQLITRTLLAVFDGTKWWLANQGNSLRAIATASSLATDLNSLYGSAGSDVTQLFANESGAVPFLLRTALTHHGNAVQNKRIIRAGITTLLSSGSALIDFTLDNEFGSVSPNVLRINQAVNVIGGSNDVNNAPIGTQGKYLGMSIFGTVANFAQISAIIEYQEEKLWGVNLSLAAQSDAMPMGVP